MGNNPVVARAFLHMWEEPCISGTRGSGTVFFSGCSLRCIFCQNHEISHGGRGKEITAVELAGIFRSLKDKGAHNINLVTPSHFIPAIREALIIATGRDGQPKNDMQPEREMQSEKGEQTGKWNIPIVYNTNGYDSVEGLRTLEGLIDIYLPDLKYITSDLSAEYSGARDYFEKASPAINEMYRQVGAPVFDNDGILQRGMIIRHLVLPGHTNETLKVLDWIAQNMSKEVYVSLMSQYVPCHKACGHSVLGRHITRYEYDKVINKFIKLGLNGYVQERDSASERYIPDFGTSDYFPES
jgi:putative pyruvate formate lyase activating enzyme